MWERQRGRVAGWPSERATELGTHVWPCSLPYRADAGSDRIYVINLLSAGDIEHDHNGVRPPVVRLRDCAEPLLAGGIPHLQPPPLPLMIEVVYFLEMGKASARKGEA